MKRTLIWLAVQVVCGAARAQRQPVVLFGTVDWSAGELFAAAA